MSALTTLSVKTRSGRIDLRRLIGRVGEAEVYEAAEGDTACAVRLFAPEGVMVRDEFGGLRLADPAFKPEFARAVARFLNLGRRLRDEAGPHRLQVRDAVLAEGTACWITGPPPPSLAQVVRERGRPPPQAVLALAAGLAGALEAFHDIGPHLDLSPETVGVEDGAVVLMHPATDRRPFIALVGSNTGAVRPGYSPVELHDGAMRQPADELTDIYAASAVLRWLITGEAPRPWAARRKDPAPLKPAKLAAYPAGFIEAVNRGFSVRREDRFATVANWSAALLEGGAGDPAFWLTPDLSPEPEPSPEPALPPAPEPVIVAPTAAAPETAPEPTPATAELPPVLVRRKGGGGLLVTLFIVGSLLAAGGWLGWQALSETEVYYANRDIRIRSSPDAAAGRVIAQPARGFRFTGKPAGRYGGIDWVEIIDGPHKGGFVNAPNLSTAPPPMLSTAYAPPRRAEVRQSGFAYVSPAAGAGAAGAIRPGQALNQTGLVGAGWVEVQWLKGGVAYVPTSAFEPSAADLAAADAVEAAQDDSVDDGSKSLEMPTTVRSADISSRPTWVRTPSQTQLDAATPARLFDEEIQGRIVVDCLASATGALTDCRLVSESPREYGLVAAAQKVLPHYVMAVTDADGQSTAGRRYRVSISLGPSDG